MLCCLFSSVAILHGQSGQVTPNNQTGLVPYNTYAGDQENVNLADLPPGSALLSLSYDYTFGVSGNNGQIQRISDNVDPTRTTTYTYDAWARLKQGSNSQWTVTESYDRYGNRKSQSAPVLNNVTINPSTNRITDAGYSYDAAGNMTADGLNTMTYNGQSRVITSATGGVTSTYSYDGNGLRVKKQVGSGTPTVCIFSGSKVIAEYANGGAVGSPLREYIYSGSELLATIEGGATKYHLRDHLSVRVNTDSSGTVIGTQGHFPFGEDWYNTSTTTKWKFTSYERDPESQNDYAIMRSYVNRLARFSSPDPIAGSIADPQSLNRYAYARNDPINLVDPTGLESCWGYHVYISHDGGDTRVYAGFMCIMPLLDGGGGGGGGGTDLAKSLLSGIAAGNFKSKDKCRKFLETLIKENHLNITVDALLAQITAAAADAQKYIYNGPSSNVPITPEAFPGYTDKTVGAYFAAANDREALSQYNGSAIYIRTGNWERFLVWESQYNGSYGSGTLMHEVLHKKIVSGGFTHGQMANALVSIGLNPGGDRQLWHAVYGISDALARICF